MKPTLIGISVLAAGIFMILAMGNRTGSSERRVITEEHLYATVLPIEFDKCCAMWLIRRFIDTEAKFKVYPVGTPLSGHRAFDVGGAKWSRQHRKCTSDTIWEDLDVNDTTAERIVEIAHRIELNRWYLAGFLRPNSVARNFRASFSQSTIPMRVSG